MSEQSITGQRAVDKAQIDRLVSRVNRRLVLARLETQGTTRIEPAVHRILRDLQRGQLVQNLSSDRELRSAISIVAKFLRKTCSSDDRKAQLGDGGTEQGLLQRLSDSVLGNSAAQSSDRGLWEGYRKMMAPLFLLAVAIVSIFGLNWLYRTCYAYIYNRKSCHIEAYARIGVRQGDPMIKGYVTVLGRKGCRFQPENPDDMEVIAALASKLPLNIIAHNFELPAQIFRVSNEFFGAFFDSTIKTSWQDALLSQSKRAPRGLPEANFRSNIKREVKRDNRPAREISDATVQAYLEKSRMPPRGSETDAAANKRGAMTFESQPTFSKS